VGPPLSRPLLRPILGLASLLALAFSATALGGDVTESFRSTVRQIAPGTSGLEVRVIGRDAALELRNQTGRTVLVEGYDFEDYLRFKPDGVVEQNERSPATYLNRDRTGSQKVPPEANPAARPRWRRISNSGVYRWFDHRIHITTPEGPPPQARGQEGPVKISDWSVPLSVGGERVLVRGTLLWDPEDSSSDGFPFGIVAASAGGVALLGLLAFLWLRRRTGPSPPAPRKDEPAREAW
jgi:hypothetical protein